MRRLLMGCLIIIILLAGCASTIPTVVPSAEKYCPRPVRPVIEQRASWDVQGLLEMNLVVIDYTLKLEKTVECWEAE